MTLPRQILPGRFYVVTRRCTQQQFLLRPDDETNNAFLYCLTEAAQRHRIDVILPSAMSNHHHTTVFDRHGNIVEFMERFHKMLAKCQNALRGRWENMWASRSPSLVKLVTREDVIAKLVYAATNPVKDGLVERVRHWPGVNGLGALLTGRRLQSHRPRHFFRRNGPMPKALSLELTIPPELGDRDEFLREVRERVARVEAEAAAMRAQTGRRVLGRRRVLAQKWYESPTSHEPRRGLSPRVASKDKWARMQALQTNEAFIADYRKARLAMCRGTPIPFPAGTYWLHRFAGVPVETEFC